ERRHCLLGRAPRLGVGQRTADDRDSESDLRSLGRLTGHSHSDRLVHHLRRPYAVAASPRRPRRRDGTLCEEATAAAAAAVTAAAAGVGAVRAGAVVHAGVHWILEQVVLEQREMVRPVCGQTRDGGQRHDDGTSELALSPARAGRRYRNRGRCRYRDCGRERQWRYGRLWGVGAGRQADQALRPHLLDRLEAADSFGGELEKRFVARVDQLRDVRGRHASTVGWLLAAAAQETSSSQGEEVVWPRQHTRQVGQRGRHCVVCPSHGPAAPVHCESTRRVDPLRPARVTRSRARPPASLAPSWTDSKPVWPRRRDLVESVSSLASEMAQIGLLWSPAAVG
ncbi:unnamed protein product, partial [Protopolystoma xenopodis]